MATWDDLRQRTTPLRPRADVDLLRRRKDVARRVAFGGFGLMFFAPIVMRFGAIISANRPPADWRSLLAALGAHDWTSFASGAVTLAGMAWLIIGCLLFASGSILWMLHTYRLHRLADPWRYDPDLDGPDPNRRHELDDSFDDAPPESP